MGHASGLSGPVSCEVVHAKRLFVEIALLGCPGGRSWRGHPRASGLWFGMRNRACCSLLISLKIFLLSSESRTGSSKSLSTCPNKVHKTSSCPRQSGNCRKPGEDGQVAFARSGHFGRAGCDRHPLLALTPMWMERLQSQLAAGMRFDARTVAAPDMMLERLGSLASQAC